MEYERIEAFEINFPESASQNRLKFIGSTGAGEKRIYVGYNKEELDDFFIKNVNSSFFLKKDLIEYIQEAKEEYYNQTQEYKNKLLALDNLVTKKNILNDALAGESDHKEYGFNEKTFIIS